MRLMFRFFGFLFAAGTIVFLVGVGAAAGLVWHFSKDLPDYSTLQNYEPPVMTRVHASDGSLVAEYAREPDAYLGFLSLGLTMGQWLSLPMIVIGIWMLLKSKSDYFGE